MTPLRRDRVEDEWPRKRREEIIGGCGNYDELAGNGDRLNGEIARDEGGMTEEEAERRARGARASVAFGCTISLCYQSAA